MVACLDNNLTIMRQSGGLCYGNEKFLKRVQALQANFMNYTFYFGSPTVFVNYFIYSTCNNNVFLIL